MKEYPERIEAQALLKLVLGLHTRVLRNDDEGLRQQISQFSDYVLRSVPLDELLLRFDDWGNDARVLEYADMDVDKQPPIVLGHRMYPSGKLNVIDGLHRSVARLRCGLDTVWAYVPDDDRIKAGIDA
ncbi:hypothetical protein [Alicyclobacillus ferrooxydans]|uniref:ParB/Sulfiredoxin domain-containing protein n=1 Tax=Alicyclobacillus ferrooxydans TaxID=471514 RepID=A0A0P9D0D9_9BACL|nr:hypothetical protein [Alicyclobacillus ferrooxydans]KPV42928.1 hypothetical protein AN477_15105 [Alicyclobacillus ferrooxydans]